MTEYRIGVGGLAADSAPDPITALFIEQNNDRAATVDVSGNGRVPTPALRWDDRLAQVARDRVADMIARRYFSHQDPQTGAYLYTATLAAYGLTQYAWAGENLSMASMHTGVNPGALADELFDASPTHYANILTSDFDACGIGHAVTPAGFITADGHDWSNVDLFCVIFTGGLA
jgi:uncharacterized protein YkwD